MLRLRGLPHAQRIYRFSLSSSISTTSLSPSPSSTAPKQVPNPATSHHSIWKLWPNPLVSHRIVAKAPNSAPPLLSFPTCRQSDLIGQIKAQKPLTKVLNTFPLPIERNSGSFPCFVPTLLVFFFLLKLLLFICVGGWR